MKEDPPMKPPEETLGWWLKTSCLHCLEHIPEDEVDNFHHDYLCVKCAVKQREHLKAVGAEGEDR